MSYKRKPLTNFEVQDQCGELLRVTVTRLRGKFGIDVVKQSVEGMLAEIVREQALNVRRVAP